MLNSNSIKKRVFIVGCPRSGTTLLQGMLAAHPEVYSLPETFFFAKVLPRSWIKRNLLWPSIKVRKHLKMMLADLAREDLLPIAKIGFFQSDYQRPFVNVMDQITKDAGKSIWVEKTPWHLYCTDEIQKRITDAIIIHIVRNGEDVVLSLVKATRGNPRQWAKLGGKKWNNWKGFSVEEAIKRWNRDLLISKAKIGALNHTVVKYEDIVKDPQSIAMKLCALLSVEFKEEMVDPSSSYQQIVSGNEPWKENNAGKIEFRKKESEDFFTGEERLLMKSKLLPYDI